MFKKAGQSNTSRKKRNGFFFFSCLAKAAFSESSSGTVHDGALKHALGNFSHYRGMKVWLCGLVHHHYGHSSHGDCEAFMLSHTQAFVWCIWRLNSHRSVCGSKSVRITCLYLSPFVLLHILPNLNTTAFVFFFFAPTNKNVKFLLSHEHIF